MHITCSDTKEKRIQVSVGKSVVDWAHLIQVGILKHDYQPLYNVYHHKKCLVFIVIIEPPISEFVTWIQFCAIPFNPLFYNMCMYCNLFPKIVIGQKPAITIHDKLHNQIVTLQDISLLPEWQSCDNNQVNANRQTPSILNFWFQRRHQNRIWSRQP